MKTFNRAIKQLRKAAEQGDAGVQFFLDLCIEDSKGVNVYADAVKGFRKAAEQGIEPAKKALKKLHN